MKVTLAVLVNSEKALTDLSAKPVNIKAALNIVKAQREVNSHLQDFHSIRNKKIEEYGRKMEGGYFEVKRESDNFNIFQQEMNELLQNELEFPFEQIPLSSLCTASGSLIDISANDLNQLDWLIDNDK